MSIGLSGEEEARRGDETDLRLDGSLCRLLKWREKGRFEFPVEK